MSKRLENIPPLGWDRGRSSIHILRSLFGIDWEDMVQESVKDFIIFYSLRYCFDQSELIYLD